MAIVVTNDKHYTDIANAIRAKTNGVESYKPSEMAAAIAGIETGGSDPVLQEKTITRNGEYTPDVGYDGMSKVTVEVPQPSGTKSITENGAYDVSGYEIAEVNVPGEVVDAYDGSISGDEDDLEAGLYDASGNLVASWDTLVNTYGMDIAADQSGTLSATAPASVLAKDELLSGVKLIIADGVTHIGANAFAMNDILTSVVIPGSVSSIGESAFNSCYSLESINIPDGVTALGYGTFYECKKLSSINIPASMTSIGDRAFIFCDALTDVYYGGTEAQWAAITLGEYNTKLTGATIHYNYNTPVATVSYNGETLVTLASGSSVTLNTNGKKLEDDIRVEVEEVAADPILQEKTITENGEYTADSGYDGLSKVTVDVPVPDGYIKPSGTLEITESGTYDVSEYASAEVNVESGGAGDFNIAYGDTAPEDTTKLWVKTAEPEAVQVKAKVVGDESLEEEVATLPTAATRLASAAVGTKVYLFGGAGTGSSRLDTINVFDTKTNTISTLSTKLPKITYGIAAAAVGTKVYLFGGAGTGSTINVFDTETNTISTLSTTLPTAAYGIAAAAVGTKVYLFGGYSGSRLDTINVFDTEKNTISTLSTKLPTAAYGIAAAAVGTKVYLFGGDAHDIVDSTCRLDTINVFDTKTNSISTLSAKLPKITYGIAAAAVGTKVYLFGGYAGSALDTINVFNTEKNTISTLSAILPTASYYTAAAAVGTKVYLFGGYSGSYLDTINKFVCTMELAQNTLLLETNLTDNLFNLLPNVEICVKNVYKGNEDGVGELVAAALYKDGAWTEI